MIPTTKGLLRAAGLKALSNFLDLVTSKTTWVAAIGVAADVLTTGGTLTVAGKAMMLGKVLQLAAADHGKNRPATGEKPPSGQ